MRKLLFCFLFASVSAHAALSINLPYGGCPAGTVMTNTGGSPSCGAIPVPSTAIDAIEITAPRLNPDGSPVLPASSVSKKTPVADPSQVHVPAGYTPGTSANGYQPVPPASVAPAVSGVTTSLTGTSIFASYSSACSAAWAARGGNIVGTNYAWTDGGVSSDNLRCYSRCTGTACVASCGANPCNGAYGANLTTTGTCPAGYTLSSALCVLADSTKVQKPIDGKCNTVRTGNSFYDDPTDPDCSLPQNQTTSGNTQSVKDPASNSSASVKANSDGSTTIANNHYDQSTNTTTITNIHIGADGKVKGSTSSSTTGDTTGAGSTADPINIDTSNLATHSDVSAVGDKVDSMKSQLHDDLTTAPPDDGGQSIEDAKAAADAAFNEFKNGFGDVVAPTDDQIFRFVPSDFAPRECSVLQANFSGRTVLYDLCPYRNQIKEILAYFLYIFTMAHIFQIAFRRPEGS